MGLTDLRADLQHDIFQIWAQFIHGCHSFGKHFHCLFQLLFYVHTRLVRKIVYVRHLPNIRYLLYQLLLEAFLAVGEQVDAGDYVQARVLWPLSLIRGEWAVVEGMNALPYVLLGVIGEDLVDEGPACVTVVNM